MGGTFDLTNIAPAPRGVPQIEVTFDIDANGIMNVSAKDKMSGNVNKITITNDKDRLTQADIDKMISEAEKFKDDDKQVRERIEARNALENTLYSTRNTTDEMKDKISPDDAERVSELVKEGTEWLDSNQEASAEEFQSRLKTFQEQVQPIFAKAYQQAGAVPAASASANGNANDNGPVVEEVD